MSPFFAAFQKSMANQPKRAGTTYYRSYGSGKQKQKRRAPPPQPLAP